MNIFVKIRQVGHYMLSANYIIVGVVVLITAILAILVLCGKGDNLIAGYNTASEEEKSEYDIVRLRKVVGYGQLAICLPTGMIPAVETCPTLFWILMILMIVITIVIIILSNTYAKNVHGKNK